MKIIQLDTGKVLWEGVNLIRASLSGASLTRASLSGASLSGASLSGASLTYANLSGASLSGANLSGASLSGANLTRASLSGANLTYANLIVGGQRSDGYRFLLFKTLEGLRVSAGCRYFSISDAKKHWRTTRKGTQLGKESLALVAHLIAMAKIAGWEIR